MTAPRRGSTFFRRRRPAPDQAGPLQSPGYRQRKPHQAVVQHSGDILAFILMLNAGVLLPLLSSSELKFRQQPSHSFTDIA